MYAIVRCLFCFASSAVFVFLAAMISSKIINSGLVLFLGVLCSCIFVVVADWYMQRRHVVLGKIELFCFLVPTMAAISGFWNVMHNLPLATFSFFVFAVTAFAVDPRKRPWLLRK